VASAQPAFARPAARTGSTPAACAARAHLPEPAAPDCLHRPTPPGPRAASPEPPRRGPRSAAPEVPSIDELPSGQTQAFACARRPGRAFSTDRCQPVENTRHRPQAPPYPDGLDGPRAEKPASPFDRNRVATQNRTNWAAGLTPVATPRSQLGRARELTRSWEGQAQTRSAPTNFCDRKAARAIE
jgi:hypothetical protein